MKISSMLCIQSANFKYFFINLTKEFRRTFVITINDILETNRMITENKLDVRTITLGLSLRDCAHPNLKQFCDNVYDKITNLVNS